MQNMSIEDIFQQLKRNTLSQFLDFDNIYTIKIILPKFFIQSLVKNILNIFKQII